MSFFSAKNALFVLAFLEQGCSPRAHFIAEACPGAGVPGPVASCGSAGTITGTAGTSGAEDSNVSFALDATASGASRLEHALRVGSATLPALFELHGEDATQSAWPARNAAEILKSGTSAAAPGKPAPFTDATRAVALSAGSPSYIAADAAFADLASDDFALEVILRTPSDGAIAQKGDAAHGWQLRSAKNSLELTLSSGATSVTIASESLVPSAWYHCLAWVSRAAGGRIDCDGRSGSSADLSSLGSLASSAPLSLGGGAGSFEIALFSIFSGKDAPSFNAEDLTMASRTRFAELTGSLPRIARGSVLPASGLRNSPAYLDLESGGVRNLFLVGPDWPRIACRVDLAGRRECGYLSEPERARWLPASPSAWTAHEVTVSPSAIPFTDVDAMTGLSATAQNAAHGLAFSGTFGGARQVLSFFARSDSLHLIAVSAGSVAPAIFDLGAGVVVSAPPAARATIEPFGNGLFRCSYAFSPEPGVIEYQLSLRTAELLPTFAGDPGSYALEIAGIQLDVGQADAGALLAVDREPADALTFVADDGNLPADTAVSAALSLLLPPGPRLNDEAALSFNSDGDFENQVEVYVTGDAGELKFWALQGGATHWAFNHPASFVDGQWHAAVAAWDAASASLAVDGVAVTQAALVPNSAVFSLNRLDVGFSSSSSGSFGGLVSGVEVRAGTP